MLLCGETFAFIGSYVTSSTGSTIGTIRFLVAVAWSVCLKLLICSGYITSSDIIVTVKPNEHQALILLDTVYELT